MAKNTDNTNNTPRRQRRKSKAQRAEAVVNGNEPTTETAEQQPEPKKEAKKAPATKKKGKGCAITRSQFTEHAPAMHQIQIGTLGSVLAAKKHFSTGSFGYHASEKVTGLVDGVPTVFQVGVTITAVNSKLAED